MKKAATAAVTIGAGYDAIMTGDTAKTTERALATGRGFARTAKELGASEVVGEAIGSTATVVAKTTGIVAATVIQASRATGAVGVATDLLEKTGAGAAIASGIDSVSSVMAKAKELVGTTPKMETTVVATNTPTPAPALTPSVPPTPTASLNRRLIS
jgi:methylphosphotriester-DNA--protein-cysteine methyltransferase